jgi:hypothetical protein
VFVGTGAATEMIAVDSKSGKEVAHFPAPDGMDGVYFDQLHQRVHVSGGRDIPSGFVYIYQQKDADHYESRGKIPTRAGEGTSLWSPELKGKTRRIFLWLKEEL